MFHKVSSIGQKGGIVEYVHNSMTAEEITFFKNTSDLWEGLSLNVYKDNKQKPIQIHTVYRPPREKNNKGGPGREKHERFLREFEPYLKLIKHEKTDILLLGDMNYNLLESDSNSMVQEFFDTMITHELLPQITVPTKINRQSCNLYDHIYTKFNSTILTEPCVYISAISDHLPVFISLNPIVEKKSQNKYKEIKDTSEKNMTRVLEKLTELMQKTPFEHDLMANPNINQEKLDNIIGKAMTEIPTKTVKITKYNTKHSPWITQRLLNSIKNATPCTGN